jgi:hypothetical protein
MPLPRGSNTQFPKAQGYAALIGDLYVRTAASPEIPRRIFTRDSLAPRQDQSGSVLQNVLDIGYSFGRTDYSGGEGLDWDPRLIASIEGNTALDEIRYWSSSDIDVRRPLDGTQSTLKLSQKFTNFVTGLSNTRDSGSSDSFVYVADNRVVSWYDGWDNSTPIGTYDNGASNVFMMAVNAADEVFYVSVAGDGYYKPTGGAFSKVYSQGGSAFPLTHIWWAKGRWIAFRSDGTLGELTAAGVFSTFETIDGIVHSVVGSGPAVVAACSDGTIRSYVPEGVPLVLIQRSRMNMPAGGEVPILLGSNANVLLIMTMAGETGVTTSTIRMYEAEVLDSRFDYSVGQLQLRREWRGTDEEINKGHHIVSARDELWWAVKESDDFTYVWRLDLVTGGMSRHVRVGAGPKTGLVIFQGQLGILDQTRIEIQDSEYRVNGYLILPNVTFGLNTAINWVSTVLEAQNIDGTGAKVELWRTSDREAILDPDSSSWILVRTINNESQSGLDQALLNVTSRTQAFKIMIYPSTDRANSPQVTRTTCECF